MTDKLKAYRESLTPEQKSELLVKARVAQQAKIASREANKHLLKLSYLDSNYWSTLASKYKLRMPNEADKASVSGIRKALKKLGIDVEVWNEHYGASKEWLANNPKWSAYAAFGLCLELKDEYSGRNAGQVA